MFLNGGETVFYSEKDRIIEDYGIVKCTSDEYLQLDQEHVINRRNGDYGISVLISDKRGYREAYPELTIDDARLSDIIIMILRGEMI